MTRPRLSSLARTQASADRTAKKTLTSPILLAVRKATKNRKVMQMKKSEFLAQRVEHALQCSHSFIQLGEFVAAREIEYY